MANDQDWVWEFFRRHVQRVPRRDWPAADSPFWQTFYDAICVKRVTEVVADAASDLLAKDPAKYLDQQIQAFLSKANLVWARSEVPNEPRRRWEMTPEESAVDRRARERWEALPELKKREWRDLVRERMPQIARWPAFVEVLAIGWHNDPSQVPPPPPAPKHSPSADRPTRGRSTDLF